MTEQEKQKIEQNYLSKNDFYGLLIGRIGMRS